MTPRHTTVLILPIIYVQPSGLMPFFATSAFFSYTRAILL